MRKFAFLLFLWSPVPMILDAEETTRAIKTKRSAALEIKSLNTPPAAPIFSPDTNHIWNRLHQALFVRTDKTGQRYGHNSVDPLLWPETSEFLLRGKSHRNAIALLDEFINHDGEKLIQTPVKRAVLQHDLWAVFDWTANARNPLPFGKANVSRSETQEPHEARKALRQRLVKVISRLALTDTEIATLPDNYAMAVSSTKFAAQYTEKPPGHPLLPEKLLAPDGPWVCVRGALSGPSAPVHMRYYRGRSPFLVYYKLPGGRQATLNYLKQLNTHCATSQNPSVWDKNMPAFPVGTAVALVRQMAVINRAGKIVVTPLVQSVQLRVYREVGEHIKDHKASQAVFKFTLNRNALFENNAGGLNPVSPDKKIGLSLVYNTDYFESKSGLPARTIMQSCIDCHSCGGATIKSIFTFKQDDWVYGSSISLEKLRLLPTTAHMEKQRAIQWKSLRHDWGLLQGWLETL
ncbi:MAG: hypothetical protein VCA55_10900 [Verrucomicrobiales bacterium]